MVVAALKAAGLHSIGEYIIGRMATIADKVACRPIYELCAKAERMNQSLDGYDLLSIG